MSEIFKRTSSGLTNLHLFVNADAIIFLEGGRSISIEDVVVGEYTKNSSDIRFWQSLFNSYLPDRNFVFRSIGCKETIKSIAKDIERGEIRNTIVGMDRDFDDRLGRLINCPDVLYTFGYSWENDCWNEQTMKEVVVQLTGLCSSRSQEVEDEITQIFDDFRIRIKHAVRADLLMTQNHFSFFDRKKYRRYIITKINKKPEIDMPSIKKSFSDCRSKVRTRIESTSTLSCNVNHDCFGHLLSDFSYYVVSYMIKKLTKLPSIPKEYAISAAVQSFIIALKAGLLFEIKQHYDMHFRRLSV